MSKIWAFLSGVLLIIVSLFSMFVSGKKAGRKELETEEVMQNVKNAKEIKKQNDEIDMLGVDDVRQRMREKHFISK